MTDPQIKRRLDMIHAQAASLLVGVEALMTDIGEATPTQPVVCAHPPEKRENVSTLADKSPKYRCRECGQESI